MGHVVRFWLIAGNPLENAEVKDWQNLFATFGILGIGAGLVLLGHVKGEGWISLASLLGSAFILGIPLTILATGWSVQAQAKAAATVQSLKDSK